MFLLQKPAPAADAAVFEQRVVGAHLHGLQPGGLARPLHEELVVDVADRLGELALHRLESQREAHRHPRAPAGERLAAFDAALGVDFHRPAEGQKAPGVLRHARAAHLVGRERLPREGELRPAELEVQRAGRAHAEHVPFPAAQLHLLRRAAGQGKPDGVALALHRPEDALPLRFEQGIAQLLPAERFDRPVQLFGIGGAHPQ